MKKAQINQMFVYLVSIIVIVFAGFLVVNFISTFTQDTQLAGDTKFYEQMQRDFQRVFTQYDSEQLHTYSFSNEIQYVCLLDQRCDTSTLPSEGLDIQEVETILQTQDNVALFDDTGLMSSYYIGEFLAEDGCSCYQPNNNRLELFFRNQRNDVYIRKLE